MKKTLVLLMIMIVTPFLLGADAPKKSPAEWLVEKIQANQAKEVKDADDKYLKSIAPFQKIKEKSILTANKKAKLRLDLALKQAKVSKDELSVAVIENALAQINRPISGVSVFGVSQIKDVRLKDLIGKWEGIRRGSGIQFTITFYDDMTGFYKSDRWDSAFKYSVGKDEVVFRYTRDPQGLSKFVFPIISGGTLYICKNNERCIMKKVESTNK
jgi:hypothetical protein